MSGNSVVEQARPLRFKLSWRNYCVGAIIGFERDNPVADGLRTDLIVNGFAEEISLEDAAEILVKMYGFTREHAVERLGLEVRPTKPVKNKVPRIF